MMVAMIMQHAMMTMDPTLVFVIMDLQEMDSIAQVKNQLISISLFEYWHVLCFLRSQPCFSVFFNSNCKIQTNQFSAMKIANVLLPNSISSYHMKHIVYLHPSSNLTVNSMFNTISVLVYLSNMHSMFQYMPTILFFYQGVTYTYNIVSPLFNLFWSI